MSERDEIREWLRAELTAAGRGSKQRLAKYLNLERADAITRMLNTDPEKESREIKAAELAKMKEFFRLERGEPGISEIEPATTAPEIARRFAELPADFQKVFEEQLAALERLASARRDEDQPRTGGSE